MMKVRCVGAVQPWSLSPQHVSLNVVKCDSELQSLQMNMCHHSPGLPVSPSVFGIMLTFLSTVLSCECRNVTRRMCDRGRWGGGGVVLFWA